MQEQQMSKETPELQLFPPIEPYRTGMMPVDELHTLYWEESGNPEGVPVVYVHGGPGGGASPEKRQWFDPSYYRIVLYDQRGAFRSTPVGESRNNTTALLVQDMEALRKMLGIERWLVTGGSWGTTLSLAYGQAHPEACLGFVLRGIFLGSAKEIDWFLNGMGLFYPQAHDDFVSWIAPDERNNILAAYVDKLFGENREVQLEIARSWFSYSEQCAMLQPDLKTVEQALKNEPVVYGTGRLDSFYFCHKMFLEAGQLLDNMHRIAHLPAVIVQGAHDVIAPPEAAYRLHQAWPGSVLELVPDGAHSPSEPGNRTRLLQAIRRYSERQRFTG
jgi:proline iminopeptidase